MKKLMKKTLLMIWAIIIFLECGIISTTTTATEKSMITVGDYIQLMVEASKIEVVNSESNAYVAAALREGIIKEGEFSSYIVKTTNEDAAVIASRVDELLHGTTYDESVYNQIKDKNRISDLSKVSKSKQDSVIKVFAKGIMIGYSNGRYSQSRQFKGAENISLSTAKLICNRTVNKSKRRQLSPDGQLIRTTNLPKSVANKDAIKPTEELPYVVKGSPSAKDYPYILESFPNSFYQKSFKYHNTRYGWKPVEIVNYAPPVKVKVKNPKGYDRKNIIEANIDTWAKKIETNLSLRLNADYRTIDNDWMNALRKTYFIYDDASMNKSQTNAIKNYVKAMKKNKAVVTGKVVVEPSSLYYAGGYYMRAYVKFKVVSGSNLNTGNNIIFGNVYIPNLKKDVWYERYIDLELGTSVGGSTGEDYALYSLTDMIY